MENIKNRIFIGFIKKLLRRFDYNEKT